MVAKRLENFGGMLPIASRRLLPESMATLAVNAFMRSGEVRGIRQPSPIKVFAPSPTYKRASRIPDPGAPSTPVWFPFVSSHGKIFPNPIVNDLYDRYIHIDGNAVGTPTYAQVNSLARIKLGLPSLQLGVPTPTVAPGVAVAGGSGTVTTRSYVYTFVNAFDEEGPPSPPTVVSGFQNGVWNITGMTYPGTAVARGLTRLRVYRTVTGNNGTEFYRVAEVAYPGGTYADTRLASVIAQEGNILQSTFWTEPLPMEGIIAMPNGFFAGWDGKNVYFSEPYRPWAWPSAYTISTAFRVLDCGVIDQTLVILTQKNPEFASGAHPNAIVVSRSSQIEPCAVVESVAQSSDSVFYASPNGIVQITAGGMQVATRNVITRDQWQEGYLPKISSAVIYDSQYIATSVTPLGFSIDMRGERSGIIDLVNDGIIECIWSDPYTGEAHFMMGNTVYQWDAPGRAFAVATWVSPEYQFPKPINLGAIKVSLDPRYSISDTAPPVLEEIAPPTGGPWLEYAALSNYMVPNGPVVNGDAEWGSYPPGNGPPAAVWPYWYGVVPVYDVAPLPEGNVCSITVVCNGLNVWQRVVESGVMYRLPSGFKSDLWQIYVKTRVPVLNIQIAETGKELANV